MTEEEKNNMRARNAINQAGIYGLWFGVYLSCLSLLTLSGSGGWMASLLTLIMLACAPVMVLRMLVATYKGDPANFSFSRLWSMGVMIFVFGSLICAMTTFIWLQFIHPGLIYERTQEVVDLYRTMPELQDNALVTTLQAAINNGDLPTPIQFVVQMGWSTVLLGAITALPLAMIARFVGAVGVIGNQQDNNNKQ